MIIARQSFIRPFIFSLLVVSVTSSKVLHLLQHASSLPGGQFALYFPTFFILETLLCVAAWELVFKFTGVKSLLGTTVTVAITSLSFILASSQIGFYFVTGSEIRWDAATAVGNDPEGRKLMLSGLRSFLGAACTLLAISWLLKYCIYVLIGHWMSALFSAQTEKADEEGIVISPQRKSRAARLTQFWTVCAAAIIGLLRFTRPQVPYNHMSETIPFSFFRALGSRPTELHQAGDQPFPLASLIDEPYWEGPHDHFKGWTPGKPDSSAKKNIPAWASENLPPGFERWSEGEFDGDEEESDGLDGNATSKKNIYSPMIDPLRITNLDHEMLEPVAQALKNHKVPITHVVLVLMESARKDIFPFKAGSHLHEEILSSYNTQDPELLQKVNAKLSNLTPNAEKLTGETSGLLTNSSISRPFSGGWNDTTEPGMGGINVNGILTGSSLSFKSAVMNYCGAGPLPVNFMDEINSQNYQPCIMQIFELFNQLKESSTKKATINHKPETGIEHIHDRNWSSVFLQSITGLYDDQNKLNKQMGFQKSIYSEEISHQSAKYYHENMEEINYFGYPEYEIYPYLRDVVNNTIENNERLFLSHFTSTTHHPWGTPAEYQEEQYFSGDGLISKHEEINKYLNAVRYVDTWLGEMMKVLDEAGIANETLVVFVGDHGQAFPEDAPVSGTYENGHISNFRIPLVFRHPLLPALQITANATSMSVVPTILDLLVNSGSLDEMDSNAALDLMNEYEGQSLVRPHRATHNGRQAWNFGIINPGGTMLSVGSAAVPYRLILPLAEDFEYVFSDLDTDPNELSPLRGWSLEELISRVQRQHGDKAGKWLVDAEKVGKWWIEEQKRLWNYQ
ncbi:Alkaline phosphatase-like, alpha/beta/alpha [Penicillium expansum]|uniref:Alkaline phosphatase-like, alpha/beta/alpha n=1 Tax=Penicillium expansum TaxID=27334 RepID=A0A0A2KGR8_PENEN|nr:Alkaline phosphatase-like, alpha/beta/alpha [Penicillium expansum]KGO60274.1 Alkaline phosphatase-like, alpha/beta/alpha [Penicillium expansum]KGO66123.1 Alkaline phosphatase-like, alpha/beta/alpha [Penicillium expansum]